MFPLKQSTALTVLIFAHDANGDAVTGKVDGNWTKRISKNGGAFAAMTVTITELENGWYSVPLDTGHTDTLGVLSMTFTATGVKQINLQYRVESRTLSDLATQASVDTVDDFVDTEVAAILAAVDTEVAAIKAKTDQLTFTTANKVDSTIQAAGDFAQAAADKVWASASRTLTAFSTALAVSVWDVLASAVSTASSIGLQLKTNIDATISTRSTLSAAQAKAEVVAALNTDTYAEPSAVPAATATLVAKIGWLMALARNKITQTATTQTLRNDTDAANIATAALADDGTTLTRSEWV